MSKQHNGWTNYETWCIKLWLDNEQGTYNLQREWLEEARQEASTNRPSVEGILADKIKDFIKENSPITEASVYSDLLQAAISEANFYEIAEALIGEYPS